MVNKMQSETNNETNVKRINEKMENNNNDSNKQTVETNLEKEENMYAVMHKASSCFFSVSSDIDYNYDFGDNDSEMSYYDFNIDDVSIDLSMIKNKSNVDDDDDMEESKESSSNDEHSLKHFNETKLKRDKEKKKSKQQHYIRSWNAVDVLCHDIMMHVLSFLPTSSIAAFSETARRPNFECFYFLQLQLEHASLWKQLQEEAHLDTNDSYQTNVHDMTPMQSSSVIARLALSSPTKAKHFLEEYLQSNSSLHYNMSGSHRLAYFRHALYLEIQKKRKQLQHLPHLPHLPRHLNLPHPTSIPFSLPKQLASISSEHKNKAAAAAAVLMTVVGGAYASYVGVIGSDHLNNNNIAAGQALLSVGLGAFLKKKAFFHENNDNSDENTNYHQYNHHQTQYETIHEHEYEEDETKETHNKGDEYDQQIYEMEHPRTPNPYDHIYKDISNNPIKTNHNDTTTSNSESSSTQSNKTKSCVKKPSGCVGAYHSILHKAKKEVKNMVLQSRQNIFTNLSEADKELYSSSFIECCSSDLNLETIQHLVHQHGIPVDKFFITHDGSFTCGLHTAAFHGANDILEFLCKGIHLHPSSKSNELDGGLATIDIQDDNGWTAAHFAAGANNVKGVQILHKYGAKLGLEANNGYTPYRWAERLSNQEVQHELEILGADKRFLDFKMFGMDIGAESLVATYFLGHIG